LTQGFKLNFIWLEKKIWPELHIILAAPEGVQIHSQERDHSISSKQVKNGLRIWKAV